MMILGLGFFIGIFLGSLVYCLAMRSLAKQPFGGRSYCEKCKHTLNWYDLFPVVSYLVLRGKCHYCYQKISLEYLLAEVLMGCLVAVLFVQQFTPNVIAILAQIRSWQDLLLTYSGPFLLDLLFKLFVLCVLAVVFITDIKASLIPDRITYPAIATIFVLQVVSALYKIGVLYYSLNKSVLGRFLLPPHTDYLWVHSFVTLQPFLWSIAASFLVALFFGLLIVVTRGRGMGGGDLKFGIFLGLALGFANSILCLMVAFLLGSIVGIGLIVFGKKHFGQTIPFGPFLAIGALVALFWGNLIINWYINLNV